MCVCVERGCVFCLGRQEMWGCDRLRQLGRPRTRRVDIPPSVSVPDPHPPRHTHLVHTTPNPAPHRHSTPERKKNTQIASKKLSGPSRRRRDNVTAQGLRNTKVGPGGATAQSQKGQGWVDGVMRSRLFSVPSCLYRRRKKQRRVPTVVREGRAKLAPTASAFVRYRGRGQYGHGRGR